MAVITVVLTGRCVCGYQPGAGPVLARPPERRPVQEAQPLPGRHQSGEGQYVTVAQIRLLLTKIQRRSQISSVLD